MPAPFPAVPVPAFTDPIRHFPRMDVGELAEPSAVRVVYILAAFGFFAQAQPLGQSWSVVARAEDAEAARQLLDDLGFAAWPCTPLVPDASMAPPKFGVWTTLDSGRSARSPEDVRDLLRRDPQSVFLNSLPSAPKLPDDGRADSLPLNALLTLTGFGGGRDPWSVVLQRTETGYSLSSSAPPEVLAEAATRSAAYA